MGSLTLNSPVEHLQLPVRGRKMCRSLGIKTVADLISKSDDDLLEVRNFGQSSLYEVDLKLHEHGFERMGQSSIAIPFDTKTRVEILPDELSINLRDWFAGQALKQRKWYAADAASEAYEIADAMLIERERKNNGTRAQRRSRDSDGEAGKRG